MTSKATCNTGTRIELITIFDELLKKHVFDKSIYKKITVIKMLMTKRTYKTHYVIGFSGIFGKIVFE